MLANFMRYQQSCLLPPKPSHSSCSSCGKNDFVETSCAELVCKGCGLVVEAHLSECSSDYLARESWSAPELNAAQKQIVAAAGASAVGSNIVGGDKKLQTLAFRVDRNISLKGSKMRVCNKEATGAIRRIACILSLKDNCVADAIAVLETASTLSLRRKPEEWATAAVYVACARLGIKRSIGELAKAAGADKKATGTIISAIGKWLPGLKAPAATGGKQSRPAQPSAILPRVFSSLRLAREDEKAIKALVSKACPEGGVLERGFSAPWDGRTPAGIAAGAIYTVTQISGRSTIPLSDILAACGVSENTARIVNKELLAANILPPWMAAIRQAQEQTA